VERRCCDVRFLPSAVDKVFIGNLAEEVNRIRAEIGESGVLTPKAVGGDESICRLAIQWRARANALDGADQ
jgi:hypothetical protein